MSAPQVLCVGETMGVVTSTDASPLSTASTFTLSQGGAESNVGQYLAELGVAVAWASALGEDPVGDRILTALEQSGINTHWVRRTAEAPTGLYLKDPGAGVHYYRSTSAASRLSPADTADWPIGEVEWLHLSGITPALSESCHALVVDLITAASAAGTKVSFDVNHRPALWSVGEAGDVLRMIADSSDVVMVGRDEAERLWGTRTAEAIAALLPRPELVVVKDGAVEAVEFHRTPSGEVVTRSPARAVDVIEEVGAGDAFAGGYLAGLIDGLTAAQRLNHGHDLASWVLQVPGDHRSLDGFTFTDLGQATTSRK